MLIPFVDIDPTVAATLINNSYVNKLATEAYQCLMGTLFRLSPESFKQLKGVTELPSKYGYSNHPFVRDWLCQTSFAWDWTTTFALAACEEYSRRFHGRVHGMRDTLKLIKDLHKPSSYECHDYMAPPLPKAAKPMPLTLGELETVVQEYRGYFCDQKNGDTWQWLYEPRARRPDWMPPRNAIQECEVERTRVRMDKEEAKLARKRIRVE